MSKLAQKILLSVIAFLSSSSALIGSAHAEICEVIFHDHQFQKNKDWLEEQGTWALDYILAAIGPNIPGADPGAMWASPTGWDPSKPQSQNYRYHWKRDAALTLRELVALWIKALAKGDQVRANYLFKKIMSYNAFSRKLQLTPNNSGAPEERGVGDPKFNLDGSAFLDGWVRPQNDGPGLESTTLIGVMNQLLDLNQKERIPEILQVVRVNLAVIEKYWKEPTGNVWEDKRGDHFYTRFAQWKALRDGASLMKRLNEPARAEQLLAVAGTVQATLPGFYDSQAGYVRASINPVSGVPLGSSLDAEVILAVLHSSVDGEAFSAVDPRILSTAHHFVKSFEHLYEINKITQSQTGEALGLAIGRYQEDTYDGYGDSAGNPWFLTTLGMAEFHMRFEGALKKARSLKVTSLNIGFLNSLEPSKPFVVGMEVREGMPEYLDLLASNSRRAAGYIQRVKYHAGKNGHLSEQFNRNTGIMQGVDDLTWSNAAVLSLLRVLKEAGNIPEWTLDAQTLGTR